MKKSILFLFIVFAASCSSLETKRFGNANIYLNSHIKTSEVNRIAILEGFVLIGMNPCESIAAVGEPYFYKVEKDPKWKPDKKELDIIMNQCKEPDKSIIELYFKNSFQYGKEYNYSVIYINGLAAKVERLTGEDGSK